MYLVQVEAANGLKGILVHVWYHKVMVKNNNKNLDPFYITSLAEFTLIDIFDHSFNICMITTLNIIGPGPCGPSLVCACVGWLDYFAILATRL